MKRKENEVHFQCNLHTGACIYLPYICVYACLSIYIQGRYKIHIVSYYIPHLGTQIRSMVLKAPPKDRVERNSSAFTHESRESSTLQSTPSLRVD